MDLFAFCFCSRATPPEIPPSAWSRSAEETLDRRLQPLSCPCWFWESNKSWFCTSRVHTWTYLWPLGPNTTAEAVLVVWSRCRLITASSFQLYETHVGLRENIYFLSFFVCCNLFQLLVFYVPTCSVHVLFSVSNVTCSSIPGVIHLTWERKPRWKLTI